MIAIKHILIVEDDRTLSHGILLTLKQECYAFTQAFTIKEAEKHLSEIAFDLILLDVNLPDGSGFDLCKKIRQALPTPIIFLTANDMEIDVVTGLELGGDDYITKPFSLMILRARVAAQLRRNPHILREKKVILENFEFDFENMSFYKKNLKIELSKTEQKLLKLLVHNPNNVLSRGLLMDKIWANEKDYVDENALSVTIKRLRDKLEDYPTKPQHIKTVYGIGYKWVVNANG